MKVALVFLLMLFSSLLYAQSKESNISDSTVVLSAEDYAFAITVPGGWTLELGHGTWSGTKAILYPRGVSKPRMQWGSPDAWITIGISSKRAEGNQTLKNLVAFFAKVDSNEALTASDQPNLFTKDKKSVITKRKVGTRHYGARAYVDDQTIVAAFELRRFDEQAFNQAFPTFKQIIKSYRSVAVDKKPAK